MVPGLCPHHERVRLNSVSKSLRVRAELFSPLFCLWPFARQPVKAQPAARPDDRASHFSPVKSPPSLRNFCPFHRTPARRRSFHLELFSSYYPKFLFFYTLLPQSCHFDLLSHSLGAAGPSCCSPTHTRSSQENYLYCPGLGPGLICVGL